MSAAGPDEAGRVVWVAVVPSAEYAVVTAAGCGFATILIKLLTSDFGQQLLKTLFEMVMKVVGL